MNIFFSTGMKSLKYGGFEKMLVILAKRASNGGHTLTVQFEETPENEAFVQDIISCGARLEIIRTKGSVLSGFFKILSFINRNDIDIVHTTFSPAKDICVLAGKLAGKRVVSHFRNLDPARGRTGLRGWMVTRLSDRNLAVSGAVRDELVSRGASSAKTFVFYNGVDVSNMMRKEEACSSAGVPVKSKVLLSVLWDDPVKGVDLLLKSFAFVLDQEPDAWLWIAGEACNSEAYRELAVSLGVDERIDWLGVRNDIPALMNCCDIYVQPSRNESFSRTACEAMAAGKPVVGFRVGGLPEVVQEGLTGYLVNAEDCESLAGSITLLLKDGNKREEMGRAARKRAEKNFSLSLEVDRLVELYGKLI